VISCSAPVVCEEGAVGGDNTGPLVMGQRAYILLQLKGMLSEEKADDFDEKLTELLDRFNGKRIGTMVSSDD
jgi:hypothetical protein